MKAFNEDETDYKLPTELKTAWLEALRSGEYKQTRMCLRDTDGYCCLGVLTDLYAKEKEVEWKFQEHYQMYSLGEHNGYLPPPVVVWADLSDYNPTIFDGTKLATLNDRQNLSFNDIADIIEGAQVVHQALRGTHSELIPILEALQYTMKLYLLY